MSSLRRDLILMRRYSAGWRKRKWRRWKKRRSKPKKNNPKKPVKKERTDNKMRKKRARK
jgi:hypothetical protein